MKSKKVWRHWCDFCKKGSLRRDVMAKHEERCTLNPNRVCGVCKMQQLEQPDLKTLIAILPEPKKYEITNDLGGIMYHDAFYGAIEEAMPKLRKASDNCPACILAALRQGGIHPSDTEFDFKAELDRVYSGCLRCEPEEVWMQ